MANVCSFELKVVGKHDNVCNFLTCFFGEEEYETSQMPTRVYDGTDCYNFDSSDPERTAAFLTGSCAWSVSSAFLDFSEPGNKNQILSFSKKHSLTLEFYSEECGMEFAEHYIIEKGKITTKEVVRFQEYYIEDVEDNLDDFLEEDFVKANGITKENYLEKFDGEDYLRLGGFGDCEFTI